MESQLRTTRPRTVFVTGGPGSGKGTQCAVLVKELKYEHTSIGDLMRNEIKQGTPDGLAVEAIVKSGNLVPKEMTVDLLLKTLAKLKARTVLIDGFPRSTEQAVYLEQITQPIDFILHFDTDREDILVNRLIERGKSSGRADDKEDTIRYRFQVYKSESAPVVNLYDPFNIIRRVDCLAPINEVFKRTIRALRPEVFFIVGPLYSGKTCISKYIGSKYNLTWISLESVKNVHKKAKKPVLLTDDLEITNALVSHLQNLREEYRVIVEGFPENIHQAKHFARIIGEPNRVVYLRCSKETAQQRLLQEDKHSTNYSSPAIINKLYETFTTNIESISNYYKSALGKYYGEVLAEYSSDEVIRKVENLVIPEVILVRGQVNHEFLNYFHRQGYKLVNCIHLVELWRNARGLSESKNQENLSEDEELLSILRNLVLSGNGVCKFVLYNFALESEELAKAFESKVCPISVAYYLTSNIPDLIDKASLYFFNEGKLKVIFTNNLTEESIKMQLKEFDEVNKNWVVLVNGPVQAGKTSVAKVLNEQLSMVLLDYQAVFEETKSFHSTDEDQRDSVTFTELVGGVKRFIDKQVGKVVVIDGLPPNDVLTGNDPKYPALPAVTTDEEGFVLEEDLNASIRVDLLAQRVNDFINELRVLVTIQVEAAPDVIEARVRAKNEIPAEEGLSVDLKKDLLESWRVYEKVAKQSEVVLNAIPRCITFNTGSISLASATQELKEIFKRKIIMLRGYRELDKVINLFCWKNQLFYLDFSKVLYSADERLDELGEAVRKGKIDHNVKISLLKQAIRGRGLRDKIIVIGGYECDPDLEYESAFEELVLFEREIGEISILVNVLNHIEDVEIEQLPVRQRQVSNLDKSKEENKDKDSQDESEEEEVTQKSKEVLIEETEIPMWNHYMKSGFSKLFHHFKGERAQLVEFKVTNYGAVKGFIETMQNCTAKNSRFNIQVILGRESDEFLMADINDLRFPQSSILREELPLDTRDLGNVTGKVNEILTNRRAAEFYKQSFIGLACSFTVFWEKFLPYIEAEKWKDSKELKSAVKVFIDINKNGYVSVEELNNFFDSWETAEKRAEIAIKSQSKPKKTGNFPENSLFLIVESSTPDPATQAMTFKRGESIEISPEGAVKSLRGAKDGYVYFGKSSKRAKNDIEFSSADTRMNFLHFLIRCKRKGYFLIDNGGKNGVRVRVTDKPIHILPEFMLKIGPHSCRVVSITTPTPRRDDSILSLQIKNHPSTSEGDPELTLEFYSEELKGYTIKFEGDKKRIVIGSGKDCDVSLPGLDNLHSIIELRSPGWCLMDQHSSTGTYVYLNTWDRFSINAPSKQVLLKDQMIIAVPGTEFKVMPKPDFEQVMVVSEDPNIRQERFRALYRMGKYIKPGNEFREFEATHKPSRDKVMVSVISLALKRKETVEGLKKLKDLKSEHMQRILEIIEDGPSYYVISEFIHGADLDEVISQRNSISEDQIVVIFKRMIEALKFLHSNGIIHGNLRPEYFILPNSSRDDGTMKITGVLRGLFHQDTPVLEFLAPESLSNKFTQSSDIWSCGVILYYLLTGTHPFKGTNPEETKAYIKRATPSFKASLWEGISPYSKILLKMIFAKDPKNRPTIDDILANNWVNGRVKFLDLSIPLPAKTFKELKTYSSQQKLHQGLYLFLSKLVASNSEKDQALETFRQLDSDMSGKLSRTEILSAFEYLHIELTEGELEGIIREIDVNMSGTVDYVEFLAAIITKRKSFSVEKLESIFRTFDTDNNGYITAAELKQVVGQGNWSEVIAQVDSNEDGKIDIKEFKNLLMSMLSSL